MLDVDAFRKTLGKGSPSDSAVAVPAKKMDEADSTGENSTGMTPGEQAMKAIKAGDSSALEEAIRRCIEEKGSY